MKRETLFLLRVYKDEQGRTRVRYRFDKEGFLGTLHKEALRLAASIFAKTIGAEMDN